MASATLGALELFTLFGSAESGIVAIASGTHLSFKSSSSITSATMHEPLVF
jgi:hypothetical protein